MLSIIIPAYNEENVLKDNILSILKAAGKNGEYELIIVEESSDRTPEIASQLAGEHPEIRHIHSEVRLGKGGGIEVGVKEARGEKIVFMDVDLSTDLSSLPELVSSLDSFDVVVGSRFHPRSRVKRLLHRKILSYCLAKLVSILFGFPVSDTQCGFKGFRRDAIRDVIPHIKEKGWFWDVEMLYYASRLGYTLSSVPVVWEEKRKASYSLVPNILYHTKNIIRLLTQPKTK